MNSFSNKRSSEHFWLFAVAVAAWAATLLAASHVQAFTATGSLASPRDGFSATLLPSGKILVAGGYDGTNQLAGAELYDPATGRWAATSEMHSRRAVHTATLLPNGKVLVAGGYNGTNRLVSAELYDPATGTWTLTGPLNEPRSTHSATLLRNGTVLLAGGVDDSSILASAEVFDPATATWTTTGPMGGSRVDHTATLLPDGRVLVAGGEGNASPLSAEIYDPVTRAWAPTGDMSNSRSEHTAALLPNGKVLVAGGGWYDPFLGYTSIAAAELYDPASGTWTDTNPVTNSRFGHIATLLPNGQVLVSGGEYQGFGASTLSSAEVYDPAAGTWASATAMTVPRMNHSATLLPSGRVLIAAGFNYTSNDLSSAEVYDPTANPASGNWAMTGWMTDDRSEHSATLLTNGQVLVAGGHNGANLASAELYDPASETWTQTGSLNAARSYGHKAVLLPTGKVLVVGGGGPSIAASELYDPITGAWSLAGGPPGLYGMTATLLRNGKVLVAGGSTNGSVILASALLFDPVTETWSNTGAMVQGHFGHTATLLPSGKVLVAGGTTNEWTAAELYDPATGSWTTTGSMSFWRMWHTATLLPNGKVLVVTDEIGGPGGSWARRLGELYDPATGLWTLTGSLNYGRTDSTATLLPNGKVLVAGGILYDTFTGCASSAELYDPITETWTETGAMNVGRQDSTATLLPNGKVLVAGGCDQSAELYDVGLGFNSSWQPQIASATSPLSLGSTLALTGSGFRGLSEASGGNGVQNSSSDFPQVQLRSLGNQQTMYLPPTNWSATSFTSVPVGGFPAGFAMVTVFVNGIPSTSSMINIAVPVATAPILTGLQKLPGGSFQFSFTNASDAPFTVLMATNPALPLVNWTMLGSATEITPGQFRFTDTQATNSPRRFYRTRSP